MIVMSASFLSVSPIGDSDPNRVPIKDIGPAVAYYTAVLGFELVSRFTKGAVLRRGQAEITLEQNDLDPEQVSLYFGLDNVEALREEYVARLLEPSELRVDHYGGKKYRVFFAKEPYGVCFCFGQTIE